MVGEHINMLGGVICPNFMERAKKPCILPIPHPVDILYKNTTRLGKKKKHKNNQFPHFEIFLSIITESNLLYVANIMLSQFPPSFFLVYYHRCFPMLLQTLFKHILLCPF